MTLSAYFEKEFHRLAPAFAKGLNDACKLMHKEINATPEHIYTLVDSTSVAFSHYAPHSAFVCDDTNSNVVLIKRMTDSESLRGLAYEVCWLSLTDWAQYTRGLYYDKFINLLDLYPTGYYSAETADAGEPVELKISEKTAATLKMHRINVLDGVIYEDTKNGCREVGSIMPCNNMKRCRVTPRGTGGTLHFYRYQAIACAMYDMDLRLADKTLSIDHINSVSTDDRGGNLQVISTRLNSMRTKQVALFHNIKNGFNSPHIGVRCYDLPLDNSWSY